MKAKLSVILAALLSGHVGRASFIPRAAPGTQFVTGPCTSDIECETACCGFNTGRCAGRILAQTRDGGCGFGDAQPNDGTRTNGANSELPPVQANTVLSPVEATTSLAPTATATPVLNLKPPGSVLITQDCIADSECESGCCGFNTGRCAGRILAQTRDGGCGFGDAQPNDGTQTKGANSELPPVQASTVLQIPPAGATTSLAPTVTETPVSNLKPPGSVFVTGDCIADSECETGCCGFNTGKCAGRIVAQTRDGGCGFGTR